MSLYCPDCGNESRFNWYVESIETRVYDDGELDEITHIEVYDSYAETCAECGSSAVEVG